MAKMNDEYIKMTEDALHNLTYEEFLKKWGEYYEHMYDEINEERYVAHD
tara:strand:+ start:74 stop:220 length:147 start_codon:yes stop_codon:yes gene_type:complete